jgi:hypothetical protein
MEANQALANYIRYKENLWAFMTECVCTLDQVKKEDPVRLFPNKEYLEYYCMIWEKYPLIALPKTRRMTISWATIGFYVWDTIFHKGRFNAFVSKKEDDANELVSRAKFIIDNIDRSKLPSELIPKYNSKFNVLEFPEMQSKIQGFPQGADQLRQFTFSGIFGDESAFWEYAEKFYAASFPTLDGGGRMTLVSSPAPGFFKKLCFDAMDVPGDINVAEHTPDFKIPMEGVKIWKNPKNKFLVFELHYTADPGKRAPEYKESIKTSMPLQEYLREYELHWDTFSGQPVYPEFGKLHITYDKPEPVHGLPMIIGFDFGLTPAAVVAQFEAGTLTVFQEYCEINMGAIRFLDKVTQDLRMRYPTKSDFKKDWLCFIDPAGFNRNDNDERQTAQTVGKYFTPMPGPIAWETRRTAVVELLMKLNKGTPAFKIFGQECPMLLKGFEGGYRFSDKSIDIEPNKLRPIKDAFSHPHDALQYVCSGVRTISRQMSRTIPKPEYFAKSKGNSHGRV